MILIFTYIQILQGWSGSISNKDGPGETEEWEDTSPTSII